MVVRRRSEGEEGDNEAESSELFVQAPGGSSFFVQAPSGSELLFQAPIGSEISVQAPNGSNYFVQGPGGSELFVQAPSESKLFVQASSNSELLIEAPSGSELFIQAPSHSRLFFQASSGSELLAEAPSGSEFFVQASSRSEFSSKAPIDQAPSSKPLTNQALTPKPPAGGFVPRQVQCKGQRNSKRAKRSPPSHQKTRLSASFYRSNDNLRTPGTPEQKSTPPKTNLGTNDSFRPENWGESTRASCWRDSWARARRDGYWHDQDQSPTPQQRKPCYYPNIHLINLVPQKENYPNARWSDGTPFDWDGKPATPQRRYQKHVRSVVGRDGSVPLLSMSPEKFRGTTGFSADPCIFQPPSSASDPVLGATEEVLGNRRPSLPPVGYDHFRVQAPLLKEDMLTTGMPFAITVESDKYHASQIQAYEANQVYEAHYEEQLNLPLGDKVARRKWNKEAAELAGEAAEAFQK